MVKYVPLRCPRQSRWGPAQSLGLVHRRVRRWQPVNKVSDEFLRTCQTIVNISHRVSQKVVLSRVEAATGSLFGRFLCSTVLSS